MSSDNARLRPTPGVSSHLASACTSPWKRVEECLLPTEVVKKAKNSRGLIVWSV